MGVDCICLRWILATLESAVVSLPQSHGEAISFLIMLSDSLNNLHCKLVTIIESAH